MIPLSLSTTVFGKESKSLSLEKMLEITAEAGFRQIELSRKQHDLAARKALIDSLGLQVWSIHGVGGPFADLDEKIRHLVCEREIERMRDCAVFGHCPYVVHYEHRFNDPARGVAFRRSIEELYNASSALGLILAVETAPWKPKLNERYPDSAEIAEFVRSFGKADLGMTVDINHSNIHEDLAEVCHNCSGLIANVHISDNHGKWEDHLPPGDGIIPIGSVFQLLRKAGYTGPCNLEFHLPTPPNAEELRKIRIRTEQLLEA